MKQNNKAIQELTDKIKLADRCIVIDSKDHNSYYVKACALTKIWNYSKDNSDYSKAIEAYNNAIFYSNGENAMYLVDRSKLYASNGQAELAVEDFRKVNELIKDGGESDALNALYIQNTAKEIAKLDAVQDTINKLKTSGQLPAEFLDAFSNLTAVTSTLCVKVGVHDERPDAHDKLLAEAMQKIEELNQKIGATNHQPSNNDTAEIKSLVQKIQDLEGKQSQLENQLKGKLDNYNKILDDEIGALGLSELNAEKLKTYYKVFCLTFEKSYVASIAVASGQIKGSQSIGDSVDDPKVGVEYLKSKVPQIAKLGLDALAEVSKAIPFLSSVFSAVKSGLEYAEDKKAENQVETMTNLAHNIVSFNDMITYVARDVVLKSQERIIATQTTQKELNKFFQFFKDQYAKFSESFLDKVGQEREDLEAAKKLAVQDATMLIMACIKGKVVTDGDNLTYDRTKQKLIAIVLQKDEDKFAVKFNNAIDSVNTQEVELSIPQSYQEKTKHSINIKQQDDSKTSCCSITDKCNIFMVKPKYDNQLLNYPDLLKYCSETVGLETVLNHGSNLSPKLIEEAASSYYDYDLAVAGLLSLDLNLKWYYYFY
jgi:tetratricopeptide (TPR) repeat protein